MFYTVCARHSLVSLFDMIIRLSGQEIAYAYGYLANAYGISTNEPVTCLIGPDQKKLEDALRDVEAICHPSRLDLPVTLDYIPAVRDALQSAKTYADVQGFVGQLRERMHSELKHRLFLFVPPAEGRLYNQKEAFGPDVARKFPKATCDIEHAGDCIAVGQYTAAVFHLMRVMERGLQRLGKKLGIKVTEEKNWQNILDQIDKAVRSLPDNSPQLKSRKQKLAAASAHLSQVKLAWRNPVMHPKADYSPENAAEIYGNVKTFMCHLVPIV